MTIKPLKQRERERERDRERERESIACFCDKHVSVCAKKTRFMGII